MTKKIMVLALASLILICPTLAAIKKAPPAEEKAVRAAFMTGGLSNDLKNLPEAKIVSVAV